MNPNRYPTRSNASSHPEQDYSASSQDLVSLAEDELGEQATTLASLRDRQLRAFFEGAIDAMIITDAEGRYIDVNPAACDLFDLPREELLGRNITDFFTADKEFLKNWQTVQTEQRFIGECCLQSSNGTLRDVEYATTTHFLPHRHLSVLRDITERKQAKAKIRSLNEQLEQRVLERTQQLERANQELRREIQERQRTEAALCKNEVRHQKVLNNLSELVCCFLVDGTLTFVNRAYCEFFGKSPQELIGYSFFDLIPPSDRAIPRQKIATLLQTKGSITYEHQVLAADGSILWQEWTDQAVCDATTGKVVEFQSVGRDITDRKLAEVVLQQQADLERLIGAITQRIRQSLDLNEILETTVAEVQHLLQVDRVLVYRLEEDFSGTVVVESVAPGWQSILNQTILDPCLAKEYVEKFQQGLVTAKADIYHEGIQPCHIELLAQFQVRANLVIPILQGEKLWGLLIAHQCAAPRQWQAWELTLLKQLATQVSIAIQQSELFHHVQRLNADLERKVKQRTAELQLAHDFESALKRITDRVRDSLDETQILQSAVEELVRGLRISCCNAALFDLEHGTSTIHYEYTTSVLPSYGRVSYLADFPEIYGQLLQAQCFQFCSLIPNPDRGQVAMLCCPIFDDQGVLGDLWLINQSYYCFSAADIRLVEQVASQCAIALRQSRLYQTAQAQVKELERLNQLKDDFLSTVSHELRTPMSSIKMAIQMLETVLFNRAGANFLSHSPDQPLTTSPSTPLYSALQRAERYFHILKTECQREIRLINDLLDLSRLDAETEPLLMSTITPHVWISHAVGSFYDRAQQQQQRIQLNLPDDLPLLTTDLSYLERIFTELLTNACKYTPIGGTITINASHQITERSPIQKSSLYPKTQNALPLNARKLYQSSISSPSLTANSSFLLLSISNTGVEISPAEFERIFDRFYRIPNSDPWKHGGTGLGLALVKKLTETLGVKIWVESQKMQTTFTLQFPIT
ncbi:MAG: PAS domain S-box protein [Scytolyngbya sp. HA4215-MV1]|jgi:PAS domain S-box-containing protein|nr:PAS domain S-box protein [Scytolyngbya sp. HA4215-MV1]